METVVVDGVRYSQVLEKKKDSCLGCAFYDKHCKQQCYDNTILKRYFKLPLIKVINK